MDLVISVMQQMTAEATVSAGRPDWWDCFARSTFCFGSVEYKSSMATTSLEKWSMHLLLCSLNCGN
jgi:hypothetical protein